MFNQRNSNCQGNVGLAAAIAYFTNLGKPVCIPLTDSQPFDLVVDFDGLQKIQVKTTYHKQKGKFRVDLRVKGGNRSGTGRIKKFEITDADYIFVLTNESACFLIPSSDLRGNSQMTLCGHYDQFKVGTYGLEPPS